MKYRLVLHGTSKWLRREEIVRYLAEKTSVDANGIKKNARVRDFLYLNDLEEAKASEMLAFLKDRKIDAEMEPMGIEESRKGWFLEEARKWVKRGFIFPYTFRALLENYGLQSELPALPGEQKKDPQSLVRTILVIGAVLVGLGIILFIAAHWKKFPDPVKILGSTAITLAVLYLGYYFQFVKTGCKKYATPAYLISLFGIGGTICLIGQIYHVQANSHGLMLLWGVLALPVAFGLGFYPAFFFTSSLWFLGEFFYQSTYHAPSWWYPCLLLGFLIPYSLVKKQTGLFRTQLCFLMAMAARTAFPENFIFANIWLAAILVLWSVKREKLYDYLVLAGWAIWHIAFLQKFESFPDLFYLLPLGYFFWKGIREKDNNLILTNSLNAIFWLYTFLWQLQKSFSFARPDGSEILLSLLSLGILCYGIGLRLRGKAVWEPLFRFFCYGGILLASLMVAVFSFRFYDALGGFFRSPLYLFVVAAEVYGGCRFAVPVLLGDIKKDAGRGGELIVLGLVVLTLAVTMLAKPSWMIHVLLFNLVVFAQGLVFMVKGQREQRIAFYNWGMAIFVGLILCRYFDTFLAYLPRSFFFIGGGLFLIAWAVFIDRKKRSFSRSKEVTS
ncbi:MAG: DUF2157 domain-containing protein [Candidatus Omnitrophota bacterium]|jgi:uncharacterized membrane protein